MTIRTFAFSIALVTVSFAATEFARADDPDPAVPDPAEPAEATVAIEQIAKSIEQLGARDGEAREAATRALIDAGPAAIPALTVAAESKNLEIRGRAFRVLTRLSRSEDAIADVEQALETLEKSAVPGVVIAAGKLRGEIRQRRTAAAVTRLRSHRLVLVVDESGRFTSISNMPGFGSRFSSNVKIAVEDEWLRDLVHLPDLTFVQLRESGIGDAGLRYVGALEKLNFLDLVGTEVTDEGLEVLADHPELRHFTLGSPKVEGDGLVHLRKAEDLEHLQFVGPGCTDAWMAAVEPLRKVQFLELNGTKVTGKGLANIAKWANLNEAFLNNNRELGDTALPYLKDKPKLKRVELRLTAITQKGVNEHLDDLSTLRELVVPDGIEKPASRNRPDAAED